MKTIYKKMLLSICLMVWVCATNGFAVDVILTIDEGVNRTTGLTAAERNLAQALTEINLAQNSHRVVNVGSMKMTEFAKKSLARIWAVTPFYCDDDVVVERCWIFKDGNMMVSHIPLIIMPEGESYGMGQYQEAVVEFDRQGTITDFRFAISPQMEMSMEHCGVTEVEKVMIIRRQIEIFRTAYNQRDIDAIEDMFSDDALIITGKVITRGEMKLPKVEYTPLDKRHYIERLKLAFARNKWINVQFSEIDNKESGGCAGITRSKNNPTLFGVRLRQTWKSSSYEDEGYLFLLWEFPDDGKDPIIHVRTWQPEWTGSKPGEGQHLAPDDNKSTIGAFEREWENNRIN